MKLSNPLGDLDIPAPVYGISSYRFGLQAGVDRRPEDAEGTRARLGWGPFARAHKENDTPAFKKRKAVRTDGTIDWVAAGAVADQQAMAPSSTRSATRWSVASTRSERSGARLPLRQDARELPGGDPATRIHHPDTRPRPRPR